MKTIKKFMPFTFLAALFIIFSCARATNYTNVVEGSPSGLHEFVVEDIFGDTFDMSSLNGNKVMVVNTASKCGLTPQYEDLEKLYQEYKDKGLVIIGFPANNFMNQEPGTNEDIIEFCQANFGVSFPMMSKISVKGSDMAPIYQWLTNKELNGKIDSEVSWNFQKYLIDENGQLVDMVPPRDKPYSDRVIAWLNN